MLDAKGIFHPTLRRGCIVTQYRVFCGRCEKDFLIEEHNSGRGNKRDIEHRMQIWHWKQTREHGWVCPDCLTEDK